MSALKPLCWVGSSRVDVRAFPAVARAKIGHELFQVQRGLMPSDWKPMASVGSGVVELRIHMANEFRVLFVVHFEEAIYVLHVFEKRSRRTRKLDLALARKRLRDLLRSRARK